MYPLLSVVNTREVNLNPSKYVPAIHLSPYITDAKELCRHPPRTAYAPTATHTDETPFSPSGTFMPPNAHLPISGT
jgi:hypothetical protein